MPTIGAIAGLNMIMNSMSNNNVTETIQYDLMQLVARHDWSYMMSDSHNVWEAGMQIEREIKAKIHALCSVHREDAEALYSEVKHIAGPDYTDYDKAGHGLKYRVINSWFSAYIGE